MVPGLQFESQDPGIVPGQSLIDAETEDGQVEDLKTAGLAIWAHTSEISVEYPYF